MNNVKKSEESFRLKNILLRSIRFNPNSLLKLSELIKLCSNSLENFIFEIMKNVQDKQLATLLQSCSILSIPNLSNLTIRDSLVSRLTTETLLQEIENSNEVLLKRKPISIDFSTSKITQSSLLHIAKMIEIGFPINELNLSQNYIYNNGAILLSDAMLSPLCKLKSLVLGNCNIKSYGGHSIMTCLQQNKSLISLDLADNILNDDDSQEFGTLCGEVLSTNDSLTSLNLSHTLLYSISDSFKNGLKVNMGLKKLSLGKNRLGEGIRAIMDVLSFNNNLTSIDLSGSLMTSTLAMELINVLNERKVKCGGQLQFLDVRFNSFTKEKCLCEKLSSCVKLVRFYSSGGSLIVDGIQEF